MVVRGRVQNGVIVLEGVRLPEGQEVTVSTQETTQVVPLASGSPRHSVLDVPTVSLGAVLRPLSAEEDLLGEMLEGRS